MIPLVDSLRSMFNKPELWLVRCVLLASTIAVIYYSADKAKDGPTQAILICLGLAAVGFHFIGAKKACAAWFDRSLGRLLAWALVICGAILWEVNGQLGISSQNQTNITESRLNAANNSAMAGSQLQRLEAHHRTLTGESAWNFTGGPPSSYVQEMERRRSHRFWTLTNSCTETKGQQTRQHCDAYRQAASDKALAERKIELAALIDKAAADVEQARHEMKRHGVVSSNKRADFNALQKVTGWNSDDIELSQSLLMVLIMALFLTVAGWLIKAEEYEGRPRRSWIDWQRLMYGSLEPLPDKPAPHVSRETANAPATMPAGSFIDIGRALFPAKVA